MLQNGFLQVLSPENGEDRASFYVYLPAGKGCYTQYRFTYMHAPAKPELTFTNGANDPANCTFYRIREAYIGTLAGDCFVPHFRALQAGEVGFAFREEGAGDFCGGFHGDEVTERAALWVDGQSVALDRPCFVAFHTLVFEQDSVLFRCNTPAEQVARHTQKYTVRGDRIMLLQQVMWLTDIAQPLVAAFMPMLTIQRLDPKNHARILTDTVVFYDKPNGTPVCTFDTTPYGEKNGDLFSEHVCLNTVATAAQAYGKESGFFGEVGYRILHDSIPTEQIATHLCIRYSTALDNKLYFNIAKGVAPKTGTVWESDVYYRLGLL